MDWKRCLDLLKKKIDEVENWTEEIVQMVPKI